MPGARPLRQPHDGAELDVPIDLGVDRLQLALRLQRGDPAAQVAEGDRLAFNRHVFFPGLEHDYRAFTSKIVLRGGAISVTRSRTSRLLESGASAISRASSRAVQA